MGWITSPPYKERGRMKTAIVIPTLNEAGNIGTLITQIDSVLKNDYLIIVVDDNSSDRTQAIVNDMSKIYFVHLIARPRKLGYASAIKDGFRHALSQDAENIIEMDADLSHNPNDIKRLMEAMDAYDADVVIGSRYIKGGKVEGSPFSRRLISRAGNFIIHLYTGMNIRDCTSGFRCHRRSVLYRTHILDWGNTDEGYGFHITFTDKIMRAKLSIKEIPITFVDRKHGQSKMSNKILFEALWIVLRLSVKRR